MDLNKIQLALNSGMPEANKRAVILNIISEDKDALIDMMDILHFERERKRQLITEMNLQLSRADVYIQNPKIVTPEFVLTEIRKFYEENKDYVHHCYRK